MLLIGKKKKKKKITIHIVCLANDAVPNIERGQAASQRAKVVLKQASVWTPANHKRASFSSWSMIVPMVSLSTHCSIHYNSSSVSAEPLWRQGTLYSGQLAARTIPWLFLIYPSHSPYCGARGSLERCECGVRGARANELRAGLLIVSRLEAESRPTQTTHSTHQQPCVSFRPMRGGNASS